MTRINIGIQPSRLCNKHLLAEHRELKRIPNAIQEGRYNLNNIPEHFTLGTGHVKFFYNKLLYLKNRYIALHKECLRRGFNVTDFSDSFKGLPKNLMNDYVPTKQDKIIIIERINHKLKLMNEESKRFLEE